MNRVESPTSLTSRPESRYGTHLSIRNLTKTFGKKPVLQGIDLEIEPGEFIAVVGRSGCGKSTFLRLLAGLEPATDGQIELDGQPLKGLNRSARIMFQDARLLPWRSVLDNVALGLRRDGQRRGQWALQQVGLSDRAQDWTTILSGGQRQRVALARALVGQPQLLLLDEPLGALDALTRLEMQQLIQTLWQEQQFTAILITHDVEEAVHLADRVVVIKDGGIDLDLWVPVSRPRSIGYPALSEFKVKLLNRILDR
ncbi:ATP-binding cassette domain-containing protein [Oculatella sp. LEGE 06141]|uniref:ABC transporter ATP-binding protein n=1 Tax=Oculatella sp. LEGE 06141 TaxID=1828648 RepID=UPI0018828495|nr:ATP-binding cassette domain-containing protein [Oculatella sp. LEGE 06141]MBE9182938.1 ATP-binding cassette domain-containing protein [Oculatella sp. LEGE 06141]